MRDILKSKKESREVKDMVNYTKFVLQRKQNQEASSTLICDLNDDDAEPKLKKPKLNKFHIKKYNSVPTCSVVENPKIAKSLFGI